jgi:5'-nucleotidase
MPRILVTNDDGVHAPGIKALADAMRPLGDVVVVAPHQESSAIGHALTLRRPLRLETFGPQIYAVDGTPTDCVNIAVAVLFKGELPDLVVSGINTGYNLGDITYSGTVSGALEAPRRLGDRRCPRTRVDVRFAPAAAVAVDVAARVLRGPGERRVPQRQRAARLAEGRAPHGRGRNHDYCRTHRPRGQTYYRIEEGQDDWHVHDRRPRGVRRATCRLRPPAGHDRTLSPPGSAACDRGLTRPRVSGGEAPSEV